MDRSNPSMPFPHETIGLEPTFTFQGYVATPNDALLLFEATTRDHPILQNIAQRPADRELHRLIKTGNIFVYNERSSGIRRWTDRLRWTPSRVSGRFLIYH